MKTWGAALHWSMSARAWCGFFVSADDGSVHLRHEITWKGVAPEFAALDMRTTMALVQQAPGGVSWPFTAIAAHGSLWPSLKHAQGESIAETFQRAGLPLLRIDADPVHCWSRLRSWLIPRVWPLDGPHAPKRPVLTIHPDCRRFLETLPTLVGETHRPDLVAETPEAYPARAVSYFAMSRPWPIRPDEPEMLPDSIGAWVNELRAKARQQEWDY